MGKKYHNEKRKPDNAQTSHGGYKVGKLYYFIAIFISVIMVLSLIIFVTVQTP